MIGVILAGGQSRRFGSPKAFAEKEGKPFYRYSVEALEPYTSSLLIVTNPTLSHLFQERKESIKVIHDVCKYQGQGPLAGIYTAMEKHNADWYLVLPIDVPFIDQRVIELLTKEIGAGVEAIIPIVSGKKQPLISIFHHSVKNRIKEQLDRGNRSVQHVLETINVNYVTINEEQAFININHQTEYKRYIDN